MSNPSRVRQTERRILIEMYQFALELSNSEIPKLYELGHYLADNLISKICMVVAQECDNNFSAPNYENKSFPVLYRDTIELYYQNALNYSDIEHLHIQRNWYQHKVWSIDHHVNRQFALDYILKVKEILISIGIISPGDDVQPSTYLKNRRSDELEEVIIRAGVTPTPIPDSYDVIKTLIKAFLNNYTIMYYRSVISNPENKREFGIKIKRLINKLKELEDPQASEFMGEDGNVQHRKIINTFFGINIPSFQEKLSNNEIELETITRRLIILAGDLALIFQDHYEESLSSEHNYLRDIRGNFAVSINSYNFIEESYNHQRFLHALDMLERDYGLLDRFGPAFEGSESLTEWKIRTPQRLEDFIKKKSINYILRQLE